MMKIVPCPEEDRKKIEEWAQKWNIPFTDDDYPILYSSILNHGLSVNEWLERQETTQVKLKDQSSQTG